MIRVDRRARAVLHDAARRCPETTTRAVLAALARVHRGSPLGACAALLDAVRLVNEAQEEAARRLVPTDDPRVLGARLLARWRAQGVDAVGDGLGELDLLGRQVVQDEPCRHYVARVRDAALDGLAPAELVTLGHFPHTPRATGDDGRAEAARLLAMLRARHGDDARALARDWAAWARDVPPDRVGPSGWGWPRLNHFNVLARSAEMLTADEDAALADADVDDVELARRSRAKRWRPTLDTTPGSLSPDAPRPRRGLVIPIRRREALDKRCRHIW